VNFVVAVSQGGEDWRGTYTFDYLGKYLDREILDLNHSFNRFLCFAFVPVGLRLVGDLVWRGWVAVVGVGGWCFVSLTKLVLRQGMASVLALYWR